MQSIIEIENLSYKYDDGTKALQDISFKIRRGSKTVILGPNGAGKTTLMFHLNALIFSQQGKITIEENIVKEENKNLIREHVGLVMQDPDDQVFCPTVYEDIAFGLTNFNRVSAAEIDKVIKKVLKKLDIYDLKDKAPHKLSYGQKKKVAIAGILAVNPKIMVFDEPLAALDSAGEKKLISILNQLHQEGKTLIIVSHNIDFAAEWAEELLILKKGKLIAQGQKKLLRNKTLLKKANLKIPTVSQIFADSPEFRNRSIPLTIKEGRKELAKYLKQK